MVWRWGRGADKCALADPKYEEEVSGCTASVGIVTHDKIYVVGVYPQCVQLGRESDNRRATPATRDPCWASKAERSRYHSITNHKMKARKLVYVQRVGSWTLAG